MRDCVTKNLPRGFSGAFCYVTNTTILNGLDHCEQLGSFDFCNGTSTRAGRMSVARRRRTEATCEDSCHRPKARSSERSRSRMSFGRKFARSLFRFSLGHRVNAGVSVVLASLCLSRTIAKRHVRVLAEGHRFLLLVVSVIPSPQLATCWADPNIESPAVT